MDFSFPSIRASGLDENQVLMGMDIGSKSLTPWKGMELRSHSPTKRVDDQHRSRAFHGGVAQQNEGTIPSLDLRYDGRTRSIVGNPP